MATGIRRLQFRVVGVFWSWCNYVVSFLLSCNRILVYCAFCAVSRCNPLIAVLCVISLDFIRKVI